MTIKTTITKEVEKEIELPYYYKYFYTGDLTKIESETRVIDVTCRDTYHSVTIRPLLKNDMEKVCDSKTIPITEAEFESALSKAYNFIQSQINVAV